MTRWSKALSARVDTVAIDEGWERVRERRARLRVARRSMVGVGVVCIATAIVLLVGFWPASARRVASVAPVPTQAPLAPGAPVATVTPDDPASAPQALALSGGAALPAEWSAASTPAVVALDDGSRLELEPGTRLKSARSAPERVELVLENGRTTFDVKPNGPRTWVINAGSIVVTVLGTRFTVSRTADAVEVTVERGKVKVESGEGVQILAAGQSFGQRAPAHVEVPSANAKPHAGARGPANDDGGADARRAPPQPSDPMAEADALRRDRRSSDAVAILRDLVDAGEGRAPLAAFTIGKIELEDMHDPSAAARWFERSIALGLPSGLDEEAHARTVECWAAAGARADLARASARYVSRFPDGRHLARVRQWARD